ncbi:unnamed protein product [Prorocentrum cordatum]|uniref:Uncharacterized protein n=1 Tax=Prorocentrum cordatum TaxID=2364126 RepID=A0ABN9TZ73_9DINO|nr:unnamed protein product [Polarella glacialis]
MDVWTALLRALSFVREDITDFLYQQWEKEMMKCWSERVFRVVHPVSDVASRTTAARRTKNASAPWQSCGCCGAAVAPAWASKENSAQTVLPVLFEQRYTRDGGTHEATSLSARSDVAECPCSPSASSSGTQRRGAGREGLGGSTCSSWCMASRAAPSTCALSRSLRLGALPLGPLPLLRGQRR